MKLDFIGTRGNTEITSSRHRRHSSVLVSVRRETVMIDCGADWLDDVRAIRPADIVLTHAHPDHAWGLRNGAPCPVFATAAAWRDLDTFGIEQRRIVEARRPFVVRGIRFEAFPVAHSIRAPAVGYRLTAGAVTIFYVPDVAFIPDRPTSLAGAGLYVGDGATLTRSMVRQWNEESIGHVPVRTQLDWCQTGQVPRAVFTHCGSEIICGEADRIADRLHALALERGVRAAFAHDGMVLAL
jgi:phosphoribosyl 1,2-cyclic phosphodiesterase